MPNIITVKIDCTLIDKARLFPGKKKNRQEKIPQYLDLVLIPTKQSSFGDSRDENTHMVCQSVSKEERDKGVKGEILGNAKEMVGERDRRAPASKPAEKPEEDGDDNSIPF